MSTCAHIRDGSLCKMLASEGKVHTGCVVYCFVSQVQVKHRNGFPSPVMPIPNQGRARGRIWLGVRPLGSPSEL